MTRKILFRARSYDTAGWVEGYYVNIVGWGKAQSSGRIYTGDAETDCGDFYPKWYTIDPCTLGQYTGLKDKNGRKIFEGDILRDTFVGEDGPNEELLIVRFRNFQFEAYEPKHPACPLKLDELPDPEHWEVVGNIWDNFKRMAKVAHPDAGGSSEQFQALIVARDQALDYFKEGTP